MRLLSMKGGINRLTTSFGQKFTLPQRLKGGLVEKWINYWKTLMVNYKDAAVELGSLARKNPRRAALVAGTGYVGYKMHEVNPDKDAFLQVLRFWNSQVIQVSPKLLNPTSVSYLKELELAINQNRLRFLSLGICTLLWIDRYDENDCTYPAVCEYTRVRFWEIPQRVVDVGCFNNYWRLHWKMRHFDVNYL